MILTVGDEDEDADEEEDNDIDDDKMFEGTWFLQPVATRGTEDA